MKPLAFLCEIEHSNVVPLQATDERLLPLGLINTWERDTKN